MKDCKRNMQERNVNFLKIIFSVLAFVLIFNIAHAENDSTKTKKVNFSIYPVIGYTPETSFSFGVLSFIVFGNADKKKDEYYRPSSVSPYFLYTLNNQMLLAIDLNLFFKKGYYLDAKPRFFNYPNFFFGIGNENTIEDEESYTNKYIRFDGRFMKFIDQKWSAGLRFDIQYNDLSEFVEGGQLASGTILGTEGGLSSGIGPAGQLDTRDNILYPSKGIWASAEITFYSKVFGSRFDYIHYLIDVRKYTSIKSKKNILAFQAAGTFTSGSDVPFYNLQKVGGDSRLRGIENDNLYIDKQAFWIQAEYRRELFWRFGGVAFAGFGDVAPNFSAYRFDELKYVVGLGGRFRVLRDEKLNVRIDAGLGPNKQYAFYFSIKEAF